MQTGIKDKIADAPNPTGKNTNYYAQNPPEVFFVQENGKEELHTFLLNFVPTNPEKEFGQDSLWTGKLYEWNLTGDTLLVQEMNKSKVVKRYGLKMKRESSVQQGSNLGNGGIVTNLNNNKISSAWRDFWSAVATIWGDIGSSLGTFEMEAAGVYNLVGGTPKELRDATLNDSDPTNDQVYNNACALRVSRALNYSGVIIPQVSGTYKGADNKNYFLTAVSLNAWMIKAFPPTTTNSISLTSTDAGTKGSGFANSLNGHKGIYILIPNYPGFNYFGASGHAGLHTYPPVTHYYFNAKGGVSKITLWILN